MAIDRNKLEDLRRRRKALTDGGGADKMAARRAKGLMAARERLDALFQEGTFQEIGAHMRHNARHFGMADRDLPGDGVVCGTGYVAGRPVAALAQDFTVMGGTLGKAHATKMVEVLQTALKTGTPVVAFKDSGGARIQEGVDSLSGYGEVFYHNVLCSGVVPQIAVIAGPCAGGAAYSPALMDFIIMVRDQGHMFITGPQVIKAVTGRDCSMADVGSAEVHASVSGNAQFVVEDDRAAIQLVTRLLSFLPGNNSEDPPHQPWEDLDLTPDPAFNDLVPGDPQSPLDMHAVINRLVDGGDFLEVHKDFARNVLVGFARLQGLVVGIVANNPHHMAGALDIDASDKAARFVRLCNVFNVPLVTLVDVPGFMPGIEQER
ncbi:MAG: acyl-CoA carboxylase subunit beta, partial [Rhodospirillales bacterium]